MPDDDDPDFQSESQDKDSWIDQWVEDNRENYPNLSKEQLIDKAYEMYEGRHDNQD